MTANMGMKVHYIEANRFYPLSDAGKERRRVSVGDRVSFWFPHDTDYGSVGEVIREEYVNGRIVYSLKKVADRQGEG